MDDAAPDPTPAPSPNDKLDVYRDKAMGWRWRIVAANGRIIAVSGEGFTRKWAARRAGKRVLRSGP